MTLARRVFAGFVAIVLVLVSVSVLLADRRLQQSLLDESLATLTREAQLVATEWQPGRNSDSLANAAGALLQRRVTLIDSTGQVLGDSEFDPPELYQLQNHNTRPEVIAARANGTGSSRRSSVSAGDQELYVAVRAPRGVARLSMTTAALNAIINGAERDVLAGGAVAFALAIFLTWVFARGVSRPVTELRDLALGLAGGDLSQRPRQDLSGELGELATALDAMAEQLQARLGALHASEALVSAMLSSLDEGVIAVDARGQVVRVNPAARELLGLRNQTPFPSSELPRERVLREALDTALGGEMAAAAEATLGTRSLAITARPLASSSGTPGVDATTGGAVIAVLDVTPFRKLEAVRRDFVANVSHELRTPLTALTGSAEILAMDAELSAADRARFTDAVLNNGRRMQRLVDDLLDLSRIESGGWVPRPQSVDVAAVARDVMGAVHGAAREKSVALECRVDEAARTLHTDPMALHQVLLNLVTNALRYTASGGVVSIVTEPSPGGATISVRDTGIGIAPEHLPRIFERFYRADPSRARSASGESAGTGLGLAIVKHLVEAHGGRVSAESLPNRGTTVSAFFPDGPPG